MASNEDIGKTIGSALGDVGLAITAITLALKKQPGFDVEAFESAIKTVINLESTAPATKSVLESVLDETYEQL